MPTTPQLPVIGATVRDRLMTIWEETGDVLVGIVARGQIPEFGANGRWAGHAPEEDDPADSATFVDWVSTALMNAYKTTGCALAIGLLFELNRESFLHAIESKARRSGRFVDGHDVLQEVFLNIHRYPNRFLADKPDAFRNWGHRIVRNTLLKVLKHESKVQRFASVDEECYQFADEAGRSPERSASEAESAALVDQAYLIYLNLYLRHFRELSAREQRALTLVEIDGRSYKEAAAELEIRLENLKMVIFRGRRKIFRGLTRSLDDLGSVPSPTSSPLSPRADSPRAGTTSVGSGPNRSGSALHQ